MLQRVLEYAHYLLASSVEEGDMVVDGTAGNGHDTVFLSKLVGEEGTVLSFDIQEKAILNTEDRIHEEQLKNVHLIQDSHDQLVKYIPDFHEEIGGAIYNLGYLPGSDKTIVTKPDTTLESVKEVLSRLKQEGMLVLVVYYGHSGGDEEKEALLKYLSQLSQKEFNVLRYGFINQVNKPPFILAVEKK
ncbi:class I SAM-dependent methyltransferase [Pontibacillus salicampi]|uniref:Class I SAM-dependent methyltransferase n=1 Tax=Pontibacillus salicampi TaxID=1449801 RepID=A0ABV6LNH1_9BACI